MFICYQTGMCDYHKAESKLCRSLEDKNTRHLRNSTCSLLSGAFCVCLCLLLSVSRDSAARLHGKCNSLIVCLPFSISPISEGHRAMENLDDSMDTSINPYYSQKESVFGCSQDNSLPSFNTVVQWLLWPLNKNTQQDYYMESYF